MATIAPQHLPRMIAPEDIVPIMKRVLEDMESVRNDIARKVDPSTACFDNVVQPLIDVGNHTQGEVAIIAMLRYASPVKAAREASEEALRLMSETEARFTSRRDLYLLVKAVKDKAENLPVEARKYLDELLQDYTRCGHGTLKEDQITQYLESRT